MPVNLNTYLSLGFAYRENPDDGVLIKNSHLPWGGPQHYRTTCKWDAKYSDPEDQATVWTILYGRDTGAHYKLSAAVRLWYGQQGASGHIGFWHASVDAAGVETREKTQEVRDWDVMPHETSHTHVPCEWSGWLPPGQRLRLEVTLWNSPNDKPMRIVGGTVSGFYGRPAANTTPPPAEGGMWTTSRELDEMGVRRLPPDRFER